MNKPPVIPEDQREADFVERPPKKPKRFWADLLDLWHWGTVLLWAIALPIYTHNGCQTEPVKDHNPPVQSATTYGDDSPAINQAWPTNVTNTVFLYYTNTVIHTGFTGARTTNVMLFRNAIIRTNQ